MSKTNFILPLLSLLTISCSGYFDSTSLSIFKENRLKENEILYSAKLRDMQKGYWTVYLTKDSRFQISQADSIPLKKGKQHLYAGGYQMNSDTLTLKFVRDYPLPNLEYVALKGDTLSIKLSTYKEALSLRGRFVKK